MIEAEPCDDGTAPEGPGSVDFAALRRHYTRPGLVADAMAALEAVLSSSCSRPEPEQLAAIDQFHSRGLAATVALAELAQVKPGERVLDLGAGAGGPARWLARHRGAVVTALDLSPDYCALSRALTARCGLNGLVDAVEGDALDPPFAAASFDLVWTQHAAMNIADRARLYAGAARMLKPGGRLALHDIFAGLPGPLHLPVPWAAAPRQSFLMRAAELRAMLGGAGWRERAWVDVTEETRRWIDEQAPKLAAARERLPDGRPAPGPWLVMGESWRTRLANLARNFAEGLIEAHMGLFEPPA